MKSFKDFAPMIESHTFTLLYGDRVLNVPGTNRIIYKADAVAVYATEMVNRWIDNGSVKTIEKLLVKLYDATDDGLLSDDVACAIGQEVARQYKAFLKNE